MRQGNLLLYYKMRLPYNLVEYEQSSMEKVRLDWVTHNPVRKMESC